MKTKTIIYNLGYLKIRPLYNNIFITLTDTAGKVVLKSSAGIAKFSGKKKGTAYVAENVMKCLLVELKKKKIHFKMLILDICGNLRNYSFKKCVEMLKTLDVSVIISFRNSIPIAHNGIRSQKLKRL